MARNVTVKSNDLGIYINGKLFGIASSFEWEENYGRRPIKGVDQLLPFELAPEDAMITGQISCFRLHNDAGLEGRGIVARDFRIPRERYFTLQIVDRVTDTVILQCDECAVGMQRWTVEAQTVVRGIFTFQGIGWANEFGND